MKLHKILTTNRRISNIEPQNVEGWNRSAQSFFYKIDRIPYFDIRYSLFQSFFLDLTGRCSGQQRRLYETSFQKLAMVLS